VLTRAPSSTLFIVSSENARQRDTGTAETLLSVGNPRFDQASFPTLADLPSAKKEADEVARLYNSSSLLTGVKAVKSRVVAEMEKADVIHLALHAVIDEQGKWAKAGDLERFNDADLAFHKILYDAAGVPDLWALVRKRSGHIDRIRRLHLPIGGKAAQIVRDHEAIVNAISKGEPDLAQSELRDHLSRSLAFSDELRVRFPGYFKE